MPRRLEVLPGVQTAGAPAPVAQGGSVPGAALGPIPTIAGLQGLAVFSPALAELTAQVADERKQRLRGEAQARVQGAGDIVDDLVRNTVQGEDPIQARERVARAMRRAQAAGIIETEDDPFFRVELLVATGQRIATGAYGRAVARLERGDHLDKDGPNGDVLPGTPFESIWNEEVARSGGSVVLQSGLASRAFAQELDRRRTAAQDAAARTHSNDQVNRYLRTRQARITEGAVAAGQGDVNDQDQLLQYVQEQVDQLYASNVPDARERALKSLFDAADYVALKDPARARQLLSMAGSRVNALGRPLDQDPVVAVQLNEYRLELSDRERRDAATQYQRVDARRTERTQVLQEQLGREVEALVSGGQYTPTEARDIVLGTLRSELENDPDRGFLMVPLQDHLDALVSKSTTDPLLLEHVQSRIDLAETVEDLDLVQAEIDVRTGDGLYGESLAAVKRALRDRRQLLAGAALPSDPTYSAAKHALDRYEAPDTLPASSRTAMNEELDGIRREFVTAAVPLAAQNGGRVPFREMSGLAQEFEKRAREVVARGQEAHQAVLSEARQAAEAGERPESIRRRFGHAIGSEALDRISAAAADVALARDRLTSDDEVRRIKYELSTYVGASLQGTLAEPVISSLVDNLGSRFDQAVRESLETAPSGTDYVDLRSRAVSAAKAFADAERELRKDAVGTAVARRALEGASPEELQRTQDAVMRSQADRGFAEQVVDGGDLFYSAEDHSDLQKLVDPGVARNLGTLQRQTFQRGFFNTNYTIDEARVRAAAIVRSAHGREAKPEKVAVAAFAPLGISVEEFMAGKFEVPEVHWTRQLAKSTDGPLTVKFDPADVPVWSTTFFESEAQLRALDNDPGLRDRFFKKLGLELDEDQDRWVQQQTLNIRRTNRFRTR